jgi:hypothetical protein
MATEDVRRQLWLEAAALLDLLLIRLAELDIRDPKRARLLCLCRRAEARAMRRMWKLIID